MRCVGISPGAHYPQRRRATDAGTITAPGLTEEMIATAVAQADARVCTGNPCCYALPYRVEDALPTCTLKGRCKVERVARVSEREWWNVWFEVRTGLVKRMPQANA